MFWTEGATPGPHKKASVKHDSSRKSLPILLAANATNQLQRRSELATPSGWKPLDIGQVGAEQALSNIDTKMQKQCSTGWSTFWLGGAWQRRWAYRL